MNLFRKSVITAAIVGLVGMGIYDARRISRLRAQTRELEQQQESLAEQNRRLQVDRDAAVARMAKMRQDADHPRPESSELLRLRGEVAGLRRESRELAQLKAGAAPGASDATEAEMKSWLDRTKKLKDRLAKMPEQKLPEFQFLKDQDWLDAVRKLKQLDSDADYAKAVKSLQAAAKSEFAGTVHDALGKYAGANGGQMPADFSQLRSYLPSLSDDSVLQGYEFTQPGVVANKGTFQVDQDGNYESSRLEITSNGVSNSNDSGDTLKQAIQAFAVANPGRQPTDPAQLLPFVQTPDEKAALQILLPKTAAK